MLWAAQTIDSWMEMASALEFKEDATKQAKFDAIGVAKVSDVCVFWSQWSGVVKRGSCV